MDTEAKKVRAEYMRLYMAEYMREWRRKNPEKAKAIRERYWKKKVEQLKESRGGDE